MLFAEMKLIMSHKTQSFNSLLFPDGDCFLNSNKVDWFPVMFYVSGPQGT